MGGASAHGGAGTAHATAHAGPANAVASAHRTRWCHGFYYRPDTKEVVWDRPCADDAAKTITSHCVLVVDMSGSMRRRDVGAGTRTRAQEVYHHLAQRRVREQLAARAKAPAGSHNRDVVSLIEMRVRAELVLPELPLDEHLLDVLLQCRHQCTPGLHGMYLPSLDAAERLLQRLKDIRATAVPSSCFFCQMEGRRIIGSWMQAVDHGMQANEYILERMRRLTKHFGRRLNVGTVGFASAASDFTVLVRMAEAARAFSTASFQYAQVDLGGALTSLVSSFTSTKAELTSVDGRAQLTVRSVTRELPHSSAGPEIWRWQRGAVCRYINVVEHEQLVTRWQYSEDDERKGGDGWVQLACSIPKPTGS
jgi:hypothetical protein